MATRREAPIRPLDLILFHGTDPVSQAICFMEAKMFGHGDFSHAGVAITREVLDLPLHDGPEQSGDPDGMDEQGDHHQATRAENPHDHRKSNCCRYCFTTSSRWS